METKKNEGRGTHSELKALKGVETQAWDLGSVAERDGKRGRETEKGPGEKGEKKKG